MAAKDPDRSKVLNFNVGVLGHIDSGKTSLGELYISHAVLSRACGNVHS